MKKLGQLCIVLTLIILVSCEKSQKEKETKAATNQSENPMKMECYVALYESDTIDLKINTLENKKVSGNMIMKLLDMPKKVGEIAGQFHGDTLLVDYSFYQGSNDKKMFKNPMAFLKKGNELILGSGKIESYLGKSYFVKGAAIDFERVKYKFTPVACEK